MRHYHNQSVIQRSLPEFTERSSVYNRPTPRHMPTVSTQGLREHYYAWWTVGLHGWLLLVMTRKEQPIVNTTRFPKNLNCIPVQGSHSCTDQKIQDFSRTPWKFFRDMFGTRNCLNIKKKQHLLSNCNTWMQCVWNAEGGKINIHNSSTFHSSSTTVHTVFM